MPLLWLRMWDFVIFWIITLHFWHISRAVHKSLPHLQVSYLMWLLLAWLQTFGVLMLIRCHCWASLHTGVILHFMKSLILLNAQQFCGYCTAERVKQAVTEMLDAREMDKQHFHRFVSDNTKNGGWMMCSSELGLCSQGTTSPITGTVAKGMTIFGYIIS